MRAVRYSHDGGEPRLGRLDGDTIVDAGAAPPEGFVPSDEGWKRIAAASGDATPAGSVRLLHPTVPRNLIAIGLNYRDHAAESELEIPAVPVVFAKLPSALVGHDAPIVVPREETRPDYEGEVGVILGRTVYRASAEEARSAVGGITCLHDVSGRRAQLETPLRQFTLGKSFDTFSPMGPCVARADDLDLEAIGIRMEVEIAKWPDLRKKSKAGKLPDFAAAWGADYPDGQNFYQLFYGPNCHQSNDGCFALPEYDRLYEKAISLPFGPERLATYQQMDRVIAAYAPALLQSHRIWNYMAQPWLLGWEKHPILKMGYKYADIDLAKKAELAR